MLSCRLEYRGVVLNDPRHGIAIFQAVHQLPDRRTAYGVEAMDGCAPIRRNANVTGKQQTITGSRTRPAPMLFVVERLEQGCRKRARAIAAKRKDADGSTRGRHTTHRFFHKRAVANSRSS